MTTLRVLTVILPLIFLIVADALRHTVLVEQLHTLTGFLATYSVTAAATAGFSWGVFRIITRLQRQLREQNNQLAALNRVAAALAGNMDLHQLLEVALDSVLATMRIEAGVICTLNWEKQELTAECHRGLSEALAQSVRRAKLADVPMGSQAVHTGRPVIMERIFEDSRVSEVAKQEGIRSALSVPLLIHGEVTGVLAVVSHHERRFQPGEVEILTNLGHQLGLAIRNATLYEEARRTAAELTTLLTIGKAATSSLDLPTILTRTMEGLLETIGVEAAEIWTTEGSEMVLRSHCGALANGLLDRTRFAVGEGLPGIPAATRKPLITHNLAEAPGSLRQEVVDAGFQTIGAWPLLHQDQLLGVLIVAARSPEILSRTREHRLLEGITEHLATAVENALLHQRVQDAAVLEERERLARELHDSLAQILGYVSTQILALRKLVGPDSAEGVLPQLADMQREVQELYAEVREGILGLRSGPGEVGLVQALRDYIEKYESMAGFQILLDVAPDAADLRLPQASEIQLMRIIQESLSNVRKHASAGHASVRFAREADGLVVSVTDDGDGFDPGARPSTGWPRFGLQTMQERAQSIGGTFTLKSAPGRGTRVVVAIPAGPE